MSTTSTFGRALSPAPGAPAAWITDDVRPVPRNVYGSKVAAEDLCELVHRDHGLPCLVLRTARFFPEPDDGDPIRDDYSTANVQANEMLYRRVDFADVVDARRLALERAPDLGFGRFIISATTPLTLADLADLADLAELRSDAPAVVHRLFPAFAEVYAHRGRRMFPGIDRVYGNEPAPPRVGRRATTSVMCCNDSRPARTRAASSRCRSGSRATTRPVAGDPAVAIAARPPAGDLHRI